MTTCQKCHNTGYTFVQDGPDDFVREYCDCYFGEGQQRTDKIIEDAARKQRQSEAWLKEAEENDYSHARNDDESICTL